MSNKKNQKGNRRRRIQFSIRKKISGTPERPRLSVYKSNKSVYCQLIDDVSGITLASVESRKDGFNQGTRTEQAEKVGQAIAEKAKALQVETALFDRGGYPYHGVVKAVAEGARKGGLKL